MRSQHAVKKTVTLFGALAVIFAEAKGDRAGARAEASYPRVEQPPHTRPVQKRRTLRAKVGGEIVDRAVPIN